MNKKHLLWLIPAGIVVLFLAFLASLPSLISSTAHRATIESLAYQLTGRAVTINGNLALNLFPEPQLIAENIRIGGPDHETITAKSLTLDIAVTALLRGHLSAKTLSLQSPDIKFPWPLPGGAAAIAPPPWLTTLHAQIADGTISVGAVTFQSVNADIFTGLGGALSVSGTGALQNIPLTISLAVAALDATGAAPVSIDAAAGPASLHLSGTFNAASALAGTVTLTSAPPTFPLAGLGQPNQSIEATATVQADPEQIALTKITATQGSASLTGTATLALQNPILSLTLSGANLILPGIDALAAAAAPAIPIYLDLSAVSAHLASLPVPHLSTRAEFSPAGADISALNATLPGNTALSLTGTLNPAGQISGHLGINTNDFAALLAAAGGAGISAPDSWRQTNLTARIAGSLTQMQFQRLSGTIGPGYMTGTLILDRTTPTPRLAGALHFDDFDLTPFTTLPVPGAALDADLEITADRALYRNLHLSRLLIDADFGQSLTIRRMTASLYGGLAAASFSTAPDGDITAARAVLSVPSAAPLATLIKLPYQPPAAVTAAPLAAGLLAAGPPRSLRTSATLTLGDFSATAAPTLDLTAGTATGPLTLRHPSAIAMLKLFGDNADLAWPGAGSFSLRANLSLTPAQTGLSDFAVSFGDLTASGRFLAGTQTTGIDSDITADTLALPPWPTDSTPLWSALTGRSGKILLTANRVLLDGTPILGATAASLALQPNADALTITDAALAGGNLTGTVTATTAPATPPSFAVKFALTAANAAALAPPIAFPLTLPAGTFALSGTLTAAGYGPQTWEATLAGPATLSAKSGTLTGFNLPALIPALSAIPRAPALQTATDTGASPFDTLSLAGAFDHGLYTITTASLQSQSGSATAAGTIDLPDQDIFLTLALHPALPTPPTIALTLDGPWQSPQKIPTLREALAWTATP